MRLRVIRTAYRLAWVCLSLLALVYPGRGRGAKAILTHDGAVLLVRHTYGPDRWELPGGGLHRHEPAKDGVRREVREELGVEIDALRLLSISAGPGRHAGREISYFTAEPASRHVIPDMREIAQATWHRLDALPPRLGWNVSEMIAAAIAR